MIQITERVTQYMDGYTLIPRLRQSPDPSIPRRLPHASIRDIERFAEEFRVRCGYADLTPFEAAKHFYSKTKFILSDLQAGLAGSVLPTLLCECGLLFERDFGCLADSGDFESYAANLHFLRHEKLSRSLLQQSAKETCTALDIPEGSALYDELSRLVDTLEHLGLTSKQLRARKTPSLSTCAHLTKTERQDFIERVWPEFQRKYLRLLWLRSEAVHYKRQYSDRHRLAYDETIARLHEFQSVQDTFLSWKRRRPSLGSHFNDRTFSYEEISRLASSCQVENAIAVQERLEARVRSNCDWFSALLRTLIALRGLSRCRSIEAQIEKVRLFLTLTESLDLSEPEFHAVSRKFWDSLWHSNTPPKRKFFQEAKKVISREQAVRIPPLQYGILVDGLLETCLPDFQEALAHDNIYLLEQSVIERYKLLFAETYAAYVHQISLNADRLNEYAALWDDFTVSRADRQEYLSRRIRYRTPEIPDDDRLWEGVLPIQTATPENRARRVSQCQKALALLIFENALQDCIRSQAKDRLWSYAWTQNFEKQKGGL